MQLHHPIYFLDSYDLYCIGKKAVIWIFSIAYDKAKSQWSIEQFTLAFWAAITTLDSKIL